MATPMTEQNRTTTQETELDNVKPFPHPHKERTSDDFLPFRKAPHSLEAEQALLGAILVNNDAYERVSGFLEPQHFFDPLHQQIYETVAKLIARSRVSSRALSRSAPASPCRSTSGSWQRTPQPSSTCATTVRPSTTSLPAGI
jgi:hypothetical protein